MSSKTLLFTFLLLLFSLPLISAEIGVVTYSTASTFTVFDGSQHLELCQCQNVVDSVVITNTGVYASRYEIANTLSDYVRLSDGGFDLQPGESKTVYIYAQAPCDDLFSDEFIIQISDIFGNVQTLEKTLSVNKCQNLEATLLADKVVPIDPCTPMVYTMEISNTGVFSETYDATFGDASVEEYMSAPYQSILIPAGEKGLLSSTLELDCSMYGVFTIPFSVESRQTELIAEFEHVLNVSQAYDFVVELSHDVLCALDTTHIPLTITNIGEIDNSYTIAVSGPSFYVLETNSSTVEIDAGDEATLIITANPLREHVGEFPLLVTVTSALGDIEQVINQSVRVESCHQFTLALMAEEDIMACSGYHEVPVIIENTGSKDEHIVFEVLGAYAWMMQPEVFLAAGESYEGALIIDVPADVSLNQEISVKAHLSSGVEASDILRTTFLSEYACTQVNAIQKTSVIHYGELSTEIKLRNDGLKEGVYDVTYSGDEWLSFEDRELILQSGESAVLTLSTYQTETGFTNKYYYGSFEVTSDNGMVYTIPVEVRLTQKNIFVRAYAYFSLHLCQLFTLLFLLALIVLTYFLLFKEGKYKHRWGLLIVVLVVWIIITAVAFSAYGLPKPLYEPLPTYVDPLEFAVHENTPFTLNAADYFVDPDNNTLSFALDEDLENMSVSTSGSVFTFIPSQDFVGSKRFRLVASDGVEDEISPRMYIHFIDKEEYSLWDLYTKYCVLMNVFLLLIIAHLLYFLLIRKPKKKTNSKVSDSNKELEKSAVKKSAKKKSAKKRSVKRSKK